MTPDPTEPQCSVYWGSHGCHLPAHDTGHHMCLACCSPDDPDHMAVHAAANVDQYGADGCAGTYPYYGYNNMSEMRGLRFFTMTPGGFQDLPHEFDRLLATLSEEPIST